MANSRQSVTIFSPSSKRPTKRTRSSITEHSFQGITPSPRGGSVTHVSGTNCHPCVRPLKYSMFMRVLAPCYYFVLVNSNLIYSRSICLGVLLRVAFGGELNAVVAVIATF